MSSRITEFLKIAAGVSTPLGFLGLVVALGYLSYALKLKSDERTLRMLKPDQRAVAADKYLTRYGIDGRGLSPAERMALIKADLEKRHFRSIWFFIAVTVAVVVCFVVATRPPSDPNSNAFQAALGKISKPSEGDMVEAHFGASGTVHNVGKGVYLWLAVEINGSIWPQEGRIFVDENGGWSQLVSEEGRPIRFELSLWAANLHADTLLAGWRVHCLETHDCPGLAPPSDAKVLDRVGELRLAPSQ